MTADVVFMVDIDSTVIDNDRIVVDLGRRLERELCVAGYGRCWAVDHNVVASGVAALHRIEHPVGRTGRRRDDEPHHAKTS